MSNFEPTRKSDWVTRAKCVGRDPQAYELEYFRGDRDKYAAGICYGCPVIQDCAADALEPLAVGTVRGGVWVSEKFQERRAVRRRLAARALGWE